MTSAFDYEHAYDEISRGASEFADAMRAEATSRFDRAKDEARAEARQLLDMSDGLSDIPGALREEPRLMRVLRYACKPPLTKDKLGGMAGIRPYRLVEIETNGTGSTPLQKRKCAADIKVLAPLLSKFLDTCIIPWEVGSESPTPKKAREWAEVVSDRVACQSDLWGKTSGLAGELVDGVETWLEQRGYTWWPPCDACEYGDGLTQRSCGIPVCPVINDIDPGTFIPPNEGADPEGAEFIINPKGEGETVILACDMCHDPSSARRKAGPLCDALVRISKEHGYRPAVVTFGLVGDAYVAQMEDKGVAVVWLHDLDQLEQLGI